MTDQFFMENYERFKFHGSRYAIIGPVIRLALSSLHIHLGLNVPDAIHKSKMRRETIEEDEYSGKFMRWL